MRPLLIYIHGFLSSPLSEKAEETRLYIQQQKLPIDFIAPALSNYPMEAFGQLCELIEQQPLRRIALIGSSMGGFMATALAHQYAVKAVLVNPAVRPSALIQSYLGENLNPYSQIKFTLETKHIDELDQLTLDTVSLPKNFLVLLQTGDETLDYRQAVDYYHGCKQLVEEGGDHRFQNYRQHLSAVLTFLGLTDSVD